MPEGSTSVTGGKGGGIIVKDIEYLRGWLKNCD